jgi:hypothetical protein
VRRRPTAAAGALGGLGREVRVPPSALDAAAAAKADEQ